MIEQFWTQDMLSPLSPFSRYATGWSSSGIVLNSTYTAFNDGDLLTSAFHTDSSKLNSWVALDTVFAQRFTRVRLWALTAYRSLWDVQYSDDAVTWTTVYSGLRASSSVNPADAFQSATWKAAGAHRYWRLNKTDAAVDGDYVAEIQWDNSIAVMCGSRIYPDRVPEDVTSLPATYPCITVSEVHGNQDYTLGGTNPRCASLVQIDCRGLTKQDAKNLANEVRLVYNGFSGAFGPCVVQRCTLASRHSTSEKPLRSDDVAVYRVQCDYDVVFQET